MNSEKIFTALAKDSEKSALGIICQQLEEQGYNVFINGKAVLSKGFFENEYPEFESLSQVYVALKKKKKIEEEFIIEFIDSREIAIKEKDELK